MLRSWKSSWAAVAAGGFGLVVSVVGAGRARAEQITMFDITFTATAQNTHDAHYDVKAPMYMLTQPDNWTSPIDYTKGTLYIELDSLEKPSNEETQIDICFLTSKGYGCRNTVHYTTTGRNQTVRNVMTGFNNFGAIDWTKKIPLVQFVTKDGANVNGGKDKSKFLPHKTRLAMSFVTAGGTYTLPPGWTAAPGDGGAPATDAGAPTDAGSKDAPPVGEPDAAGGSSGQGGSAAGTGGSSGSGGSASSGSGGGSSATGGSSGAGTGGSSASGGSSGSSSGGTGGQTSVPPSSGDTASPGGLCTMAPSHTRPQLLMGIFTLVGLGLARRRRRR